MTRTLLIALLLAVCAALWQWHAATAAEARAELADGNRRAAEQVLRDTVAARTEETRRADRIQEALNAAHTERQAAEDAARRADAAAVGLRERARQLAAAARCPAANPAAAPGGPPAEAPGDLLADMLDRLDERAGELARYADEARIAGLACERAYQALTPP